MLENFTTVNRKILHIPRNLANKKEIVGFSRVEKESSFGFIAVFMISIKTSQFAWLLVVRNVRVNALRKVL